MNFNWLVFWVGALATYRITIVFTRDKIGKPFREAKTIGAFFKCTFCVSVWVGWLVSFSLYFSGFGVDLILAILIGFAFSAITIAMDRTFSADYIT